MSFRCPRTPQWMAITVIVFAACSRDTSHLTPEQERQFADEQIVRRADNVTFRYTRDAGGRMGSWENRLASIVVTRQSVLVHKNEKVGVEITPASRRFYDVQRDGDRVRIIAGSGQSRVTWSFIPPDDSDGWTKDIRAVIRASKSTENSSD
jgi:hypothetical protein